MYSSDAPHESQGLSLGQAALLAGLGLLVVTIVAAFDCGCRVYHLSAGRLHSARCRSSLPRGNVPDVADLHAVAPDQRPAYRRRRRSCPKPQRFVNIQALRLFGVESSQINVSYPGAGG